ncbi:unnamed protein product [Parajaminaea phylloscopi]
MAGPEGHSTDSVSSRGREADMEVDSDDGDLRDANVRRRGRGFNIKGQHASATEDDVAMQTDGVRSQGFGRLDQDSDTDDASGAALALTQDGSQAARSVEGWVVLVSNVHEEATEEDVMDKFLDFGEIRNCHLNLDRRTGYVKGYALLEFASEAEAKTAIDACLNGLTLMDERLTADFAFVQPPNSSQDKKAGNGRHVRDDIRARSPGAR